MKRPPPSVRRILIDFAALVLIHAVALRLLAYARLMEHLLSPGAGSRWALTATVMFLLLRMFLLVLAPGWLLARLWLRVTWRGPDSQN
jgi:hypothetical protein